MMSDRLLSTWCDNHTICEASSSLEINNNIIFVQQGNACNGNTILNRLHLMAHLQRLIMIVAVE